MDVKKKIVFALPNLNGGGAERVIVNILRQLSRDEFEITLLLLDKTGVYLNLVPSYVNLVEIGVKRTRHALWSLVATLRALNPDLIFSTTNRMNLLLLMAKFFLPNDIKVHVREPNMPLAQIERGRLSFLYRLLIRVLYPFADRVVAQTNEMRTELIEVFKLKDSLVHTLVNPIDTKTIDQGVKGSSNPYSSKGFKFLSIGRLTHQKGFDLLIIAMKEVVKVRPDTTLYIMGDGEDRESLESLILESGLQGHIHMLGFQDNPYVYIQYCDVFVLNSRWEGLPNVVLEANYLGIPVVATKTVEYLEELILEGDNGYLIEVENIHSLVDALINSFNLKKSSRHKIAEYSLDDFFNK